MLQVLIKCSTQTTSKGCFLCHAIGTNLVDQIGDFKRIHLSYTCSLESKKYACSQASEPKEHISLVLLQLFHRFLHSFLEGEGDQQIVQ